MNEHHQKLFWAKVQKGEECWLWTGSCDKDGYGLFKWTGGKTARAHRLAYGLVKGPIPSGQVVMHTCDNPSCVNPDHLRGGTHAENIHDKYAKGRDAPQDGENNNAAVLCWGMVDQIRLLASPGGHKQRVIAQFFRVSEATVSLVINNKIWVA